MRGIAALLVLLLSLLLFASYATSSVVTYAEETEEREVMDDTTYYKLLRTAGDFMRKKQYDKALVVLLQILTYRPADAGSWYNAACCAALSGKKKDALEYLEKAFDHGWLNFGWVEEDPDLESIRKTSKFKSLLRKKDKYIEIANKKRFESTKQYYSKHYKVKSYPDDRVIFVTDVEEEKYERLLHIIRNVNKNHDGLFKNLPEVFNIVLCPSSKEEYNKHYPPMNVLGVFMPRTKTLFVDLDVGEGTLVHEYTHALHFADQDALRQNHPLWIIEGFATLFENSSFSSTGKILPGTGFRLMYLYKSLGTNAYIPLEKMMKYNHRQFMARAGSCYAESRMIMYYLYKTGKLNKFYREYIKDYKVDPTGIRTLTSITGKSMDSFDEVYQDYVSKIGKGIFDTKVSLGVKLTMAALNCLVFEVDEDSPADTAGIQAGDVIYSYNGKILKSSGDLTEVLSREKPGDKAKIVILRGEERLTVTVEYPKEEMIPGTGYAGISVYKDKKVTDGITIVLVAKDSPAEKAGLQVGDVVIEIEKEKMDSKEDFYAVLADKIPGSYIKFLIQRESKMKRIRVKLGRKPKVTSGVNPGV